MFVIVKAKTIGISLALVLFLIAALLSVFAYRSPGEVGITDVYGEIEGTGEAEETEGAQEPRKYIKWVDFTVPCSVLTQALEYDVATWQKEVHLNWIELLAYAAAKNGGKFKDKRNKDIDNLAIYLKGGGDFSALTQDLKYYAYYIEAYTAVLDEFVGEYQIEVPDKNDPQKKVIVNRYGLKVFSPIARGYSFNHFNDFGTARSYGYQRKHLGNDLMGSVGAPIVAVEGGIIEALGWNQYGGWRVGVRSFDGKRYYYYAHLRKDHPYVKTLTVGNSVKAGDVIGYLGMTGYSTRENVNNIKKPHLHFGMQLIFDESQKDGVNQIWINVYHIVDLLQKNKSAVARDAQTKEFRRVYDIFESGETD